ncbi:TetR family transcriptional regulator [Mycobacterium sp. WMMD1722]|uniref:TetR family transcriptional regulator n=1 Tax=Mycobacterium sp. WMMD1722 TaxID=3404117 RepID=UPI003BF5ADE3
MADRLSELDLADLSVLDELAGDTSAGFAGTLGFARLVILSGTEPYLTRTRARFEVILSARNDPDLAEIVRAYGDRLHGLAHRVIAAWYGDQQDADRLVEQRSVMVMTFVSGVMTSFVQGQPVVSDAEELDEMIRHILRA